MEITGIAALNHGMVLPRYGHDWIGAVVPGVLARRRPSWFPPPARDATGVVLLVLDGLGADIVERYADYLPTLGGMGRIDITSAVPSTTAAGLTSISTGAVPAVHGLVGYRFRIGGQMMAPLQWRMAGGAVAPDPASVQPVEPFMGRRVVVVNREEFRSTGFTKAHLRGASFRAWSNAEHLATTLAEEIDTSPGSAPHLVYAYDDRVDKAAHADGIDSEAFVQTLVAVDATVDAVLNRLPSNVALLITADHGQMPVERGYVIDLSPLSPYVSMMGGEARFRSLHTAPGATRDLLRAAAREYGEISWLLTRQEIVSGGLLGGVPTLSVASRLGDVVLVARDGFGFIDPTFRQEAGIKSMHGGLSAAEMEVPLLAAAGRWSARRW